MKPLKVGCVSMLVTSVLLCAVGGHFFHQPPTSPAEQPGPPVVSTDPKPTAGPHLQYVPFSDYHSEAASPPTVVAPDAPSPPAVDDVHARLEDARQELNAARAGTDQAALDKAASDYDAAQLAVERAGDAAKAQQPVAVTDGSAGTPDAGGATTGHTKSEHVSGYTNKNGTVVKGYNRSGPRN